VRDWFNPLGAAEDALDEIGQGLGCGDGFRELGVVVAGSVPSLDAKIDSRPGAESLKPASGTANAGSNTSNARRNYSSTRTTEWALS